MTLAAGQIVDSRYRMIGRIGSGGMAEVWCAEDTLLDRRVALKFLHERFAQDAQFVERFRREASAAAGLQHPNVVGVFDRGEHEGLHYIAMEYVEGASLKDLIGRRLSVTEAVEIVRQVLAGARFAHARGIVHRDLKPQNVLIDAEGRARVADFGIARAGASEITQTGSVLGTAQYLSPEQAQGLPVTAASDLYSVGVMLYEALTGHVPFEGDSAVSVAMKQVSERPRPPSELNPAVPRALDAVVLKALAKDPANRFTSADEFLRALDAAEADPYGPGLGDTASYAPVAAGAAAGAGAGMLAAEPALAAAPPSEPPPSGGFWTRNRILAAVVIAVLLAGGALAYALTRHDTGLVPTVLGKNADRARQILSQAGFDTTAVSRENCAPQNTVTEQDPLPGARADKGSTVTLTVSVGMTVKIPDVSGTAEKDAAHTLQERNLVVKPKGKVSSKEPGSAIGTQPAAGQEVQCHSNVTLLVSQGPNTVTVPTVVGEQQDSATAQLEDEGLIVDPATRYADEPQGQVIGQDPPAGEQVKKHSVVHITVSNGAGSVLVPDVIGQSREAAISTLKSRGLSVIVEKQETTDPHQNDRVFDQSPTGGEHAHQGDPVTIFVDELAKPPPTTTTTTPATTTTSTGP
jgi:serine/threonine-protein kinase